MLRLAHITEQGTNAIAEAEFVSIIGGRERCGIMLMKGGVRGFYVLDFDNADIEDLIVALRAARDVMQGRMYPRGDA